MLSPILVVDDTDPQSWIEAVPGKALTFRTKGVGDPNDVELVPLYLLPDERYAVYWTFFNKEEWKRAKRESEQFMGKMVDHVTIGDAASERDHNFIGNELHSGAEAGRNWVTTKDWFSYSMKVLIDRPVILKYSYMKADTGRTYVLSLDEIRLRTEPALRELPNGAIEEEYEIPLPMTRGRKTVNVTFQSRRWFEGKKVLGCEIVGSAKEK